MLDHGANADTAGNVGDSGPSRLLVDRRLFAQLAAGDAHARDILTARFLPLARSLARRYERSDEPLEDLVQVASLALVKAIDRYDPDLGPAFSSFAVPTIVGALKRHFRDRSWVVRPPRRLQELALRVEHALTALSQDLDRAPTVSELASAVDRDEEDVLEALQARGGRSAQSFDAPVAGADDSATTLVDTLGADDDGFALAESRAMLDSLKAGLSARSCEVLRLRFEEDLTQAQIGKQLGISQMQISRIIRQALAQMRARTVASEGDEEVPRERCG